MAKGGREKIRLNSTAGTGHFYTTTKNKRTTPEKLEMKKYDPVVRKHVLYKEAGKSKGFGFVEMPNDEEGMKAIEDLNGQKLQFDGDEDSAEAKEVKVSVARPRQQTQNVPQQRGFRPNNGYQARNRQPYYGGQGGYRNPAGQNFRPQRPYNQGYNRGYN